MGVHKHGETCKKLSLKCTMPENHRHNPKKCWQTLPGEKKESLCCWIEVDHKHTTEDCYIKVIDCRTRR